MEDIVFSFNPILIMIGVMLTGMAIYTSLELCSHMTTAKSSRMFLFFGSAISMAIGIWIMNFFGILAFNLKNIIDQLIHISFLTLVCSFIMTSLAYLFFIGMKKRKKVQLYIGSLFLASAVILTNMIGAFSMYAEISFNSLLIVWLFLILTALFIFCYWFLLYRKMDTISVWTKSICALLLTVAVGQGFLFVMKAALLRYESNYILANITVNEVWIIYIIIFLSFVLFGGLIMGSMITSKEEHERNLYAEDVMNALNRASIVLITDPQGIITYASDRFLELSRYSRSELMGKSYSLLITTYGQRSFFSDMESRLRKGDMWEGEVNSKTKDDQIWWADMTVIPFQDKNSRPYQYVAIMTNSTNRKVVEKELKTSVKEVQDYKYALDQASIVAITDARGIITKVNDNFCKISKYTRDELIGSNHSLLNSRLHSTEFFKDLWKTIRNGQVWKGEICNRAKDGSYYWVETTIIPFLNEHFQPYQYLAIRNDITEKKKQEEILYRQEKLSAVGQLAAGIAHEIRNPLTSMRGYAEFLLLDEEEESRREHLEIILDEINRVNNIVEEFMMLAKPQPELFTKNNVSHILKNTMTLLAYEAKKKKVWLSFEQTENSIMILCDENKLKQVFLNIIKNGIEATPAGGKITISVKKSENDMIITITDTGIGMESSKVRKIGEPFYTTKKTGTGLGLMISFKIIENHNGKIEIESEPGKGTSFIVYLPLLKESYAK